MRELACKIAVYVILVVATTATLGSGFWIGYQLGYSDGRKVITNTATPEMIAELEIK